MHCEGNDLGISTSLSLPSVFNPFPHIDTFWRLCSRQIFENISDKRRNCSKRAISPLPQYFLLLVKGYPFNFLFIDKICSKSALDSSYEGKG